VAGSNDREVATVDGQERGDPEPFSDGDNSCIDRSER
jgi:hypothetical protein